MPSFTLVSSHRLAAKVARNTCENKRERGKKERDKASSKKGANKANQNKAKKVEKHQP
jgi:hypothetical protein